MSEGDQLPKLRSLILGAFEVARSGGKPDWWRMQTGVLKNRILQATERRFVETEFGFSSFGDLIEGVPDLLRPVAGSQPPAVELIDAFRATMVTGGVPQLAAKPSGRLRSDLWRAVLDYSNAAGWLWDAEIGIAVPSDGASTAPALPTVDAEILSGWRREFATGVANDSEFLEAVTTWATRGLPTAALPKPLQTSWNAFLKAKSLERLTKWFEAHGIPFPADGIESSRAASPHPGPTGADLRRYLHACIEAMTDDEVRALAIPVGVALRVLR